MVKHIFSTLFACFGGNELTRVCVSAIFEVAFTPGCHCHAPKSTPQKQTASLSCVLFVLFSGLGFGTIGFLGIWPKFDVNISHGTRAHQTHSFLYQTTYQARIPSKPSTAEKQVRFSFQQQSVRHFCFRVNEPNFFFFF